MDRLAVELLQQIFLLACTDGGFTGASLSRVSKHIRDVSRPVRFHSIALLAPFPDKIEQFASCYVQQRALCHGATPKVRHLLVASAIRQADPARVVLKPSPDGDATKYSPDANVIKKQREASLREQRKFASDVAALLQLLAPDLVSLTLVHCHRYGKPEMRLPDTIEVPGGFPLLQEFTIAGIQPKFTSPECPSGSLYPSLERLHLSLVALSGCPDLNIVAWGENAPKLTHLRISNVNYWPRTIMDSVRKVFESEQLNAALKQVIVQPHSPPPMGGPCGTPHFVFTSFMESLTAACKPCYNPNLPTTLLPPSRNMREHDWEAVMRNQWVDRICGGPGCWDTTS
ncbi:hypothetical protein L226DRAFT_530354 [Lentinus tigrinus ALCF2SS1-7]|uniref:F-box domain-containing protein n=1 Tax=Lentinus tigrinus ALCF2SS1-6 TaxID=1328759 RepID=A0A5C2ST47_9APHY|nr:hypothetical protein L227DRAFT_570145 [Lentinus tigrinus ALCF2SS1-6]RPD80181.1 hypothetical protein L226DRAFT_530354 [Lentinus tigrinus ALCF2SS1-7]